MRTAPLLKMLLYSVIGMTLAACHANGDDEDGDGGTPAVQASEVIALTSTNKLISFTLATPGTTTTNVSITGMQSGENMIGIDYRPADRQLYGLGSTGRIYTINPDTGAATVKATLAADGSDATDPFTVLSGTAFGIDFNPLTDRLRIVSNTGQNLRVNVDTGAATTDAPINGAASGATLTAAAYTNSFAGTASTTLFVIDASRATLYIQDPPNNGTLTTPVGLGVVPASFGGFDIDARTNKGYATLTVGGGATNLYSIKLGAMSNAATFAGALGTLDEITGLALRPPEALVHGLTVSGRLIAFRALAPNTITSDLAVTGLATGEVLLGIDIRPKDGLLYGLTSTARIVTIDPATAAATARSTLAADTADTTFPFRALDGAGFAVDFDPVADRLRVISSIGQNLRVDVDNGATVTDDGIRRAPGGAIPTVSAGAYTNSFADAAATSLFVVDTNSDTLALQNPPNEGTLTDIGGLGIDAGGDVAMDIAGGANGLVLGALRTAFAGPTVLYRIDVATGAAAPINGSLNPPQSVVGDGSPTLTDIAISLK